MDPEVTLSNFSNALSGLNFRECLFKSKETGFLRMAYVEGYWWWEGQTRHEAKA